MKALITGATSGIGMSMAKYLCSMGWELVLTGRNKNALENLKSELNTNVYIIPADLSEKEEVFKVYHYCKLHDIDMLINNAGYGIFGRFDETDIEDELNMLNVNITALHILTKLFLRDFKKKNRGIILNVASSAGFMTGPLLSSYYASKNYVVRLSLAIAQELKKTKSKVRISIFCPGPVDTNFNNRAGVVFSVKPISADFAAKYAIDNALSGRTVIIPTFKMKLGVLGAKLAPEKILSSVTYTIQNLAGAGDHIVAAKTIYGGSYNLLEHTLPTYGIKTTFVDPDEEGAFENAIQDNTKAIYIESLGNPNSNIIDIEKVAAIAHAHKIPLVVDSTFATPYLLRPIEHGADIVVHSATKFIGGHGTAIGGVIVDSGKFDWEASGKFPSLVEPNPSYHGVSFTKAAGPAAFVTKIRAILLRDTGATISPFHAFIFLQGLETLSLRVERHVENALKVVDFLKNHPQVERVNHPSLPESGYKDLYDKYFPKGAGSIFTFEIKGTSEDAQKFIDNLKVFSLLANVADVKSLAIHPATTTHSQLNEEELAEQGIKPNTIRLSIGTEHIDDIIFDLEEAFKAVANK